MPVRRDNRENKREVPKVRLKTSRDGDNRKQERLNRDRAREAKRKVRDNGNS